mgnify:CR=1 FL=1
MVIVRHANLRGVCALLGLLSLPAHAQDFHPLSYAPAPVDNPLKGFVPYESATAAKAFPCSLEWFYIPLAELMPAAKTFDWAPFEKHLNAIAARGHQAVMRVYLDYPGKTPGLPKFLFDAGVAALAYDYSHNNSRSLSPDYEDPRLRAALADFIAAFGAKYAGDPRLGFITAGLLGYWGEWHTSDHKDRLASKTVQRDVMDAYLRAFRRPRLLLRYPAGPDASYYADNRTLAMGYHDDSFAYATMPSGKPASWFFLDRMTRAGALDKWRTQPVGGEVRPEVWDNLWNDPTGAPPGQEYLPCVEATHATWLMNSGVFRPALQGAARERALAGARRLGYEFHVAEAAIGASPGHGVRVRLRVRNDGVAPFYYSWPVELSALDATGRLVAAWRTDWNLAGLQPDKMLHDFEATSASLNLPAGNYRVLLRVVNPLPHGLPLRFANQAQDADQPGWLTLGSAKL